MARVPEGTNGKADAGAISAISDMGNSDHQTAKVAGSTLGGVESDVKPVMDNALVPLNPHPKPSTFNSEAEPRNPKPATPNPEALTVNFDP